MARPHGMTKRINRLTCKNCYQKHKNGRGVYCWCHSPEDMISKPGKCPDWYPQEAK
ncbi:hypothetical protein ACFLYL_01885 [Chloroflexota bacterium]